MLVENRDFFIHPLHSAPPLGGPRRNIAIPFGVEKLELWGYPIVKKTLRICVTVYTQYRRVTDGQTSCHGIVRTMHTRRTVKSEGRATITLHTLLGLSDGFALHYTSPIPGVVHWAIL